MEKCKGIKLPELSVLRAPVSLSVCGDIWVSRPKANAEASPYGRQRVSPGGRLAGIMRKTPHSQAILMGNAAGHATWPAWQLHVGIRNGRFWTGSYPWKPQQCHQYRFRMEWPALREKYNQLNSGNALVSERVPLLSTLLSWKSEGRLLYFLL